MAIFVVLAIILPLVLSVISQITSGNDAPDTTDTRPQMPDFVLPSADGRDVHLAEIASTHSAVVIVFYRGFDCSVCRDQIAELAASYTELRQQGAEVLAISTDTQENAILMVQRSQAGFPVLFDSAGFVPSVYRITEQLASDFTTAIFIMDRDMRLVGAPVGTTGPEVLPAEVVLDAIRQINGSDATSS
ncbi:MAG: peroxiredoxin family protein [Chloroflexi bacterium]|nr:peroxiredoxin family protein [Chloroflexota bacterium]